MMPESAETHLAAVAPWDQGAPGINGPRVFGAGIGSPFVFPIAATGERPLDFEAEGLPHGLYPPAGGLSRTQWSTLPSETLTAATAATCASS